MPLESRFNSNLCNQITEIYKITNLINGKIYVGRTRNGIVLRWKRHVWGSKKRNTYLGRAIQKHGHENFIIELIEITDHAEANKRETFWIRQLKSHNDAIGYNLTWCANGAGEVTIASRLKLGRNSKKFWDSMTSKERSALLSARMTGIRHTEIHKTQLSKAKAGTSSDVAKTSRFVGVCKRIHSGRTHWIATCYLRGKQYTRSFESERAAAQCYDRFALVLHGSGVRLNFPGKRNSYLAENLSQFLNLKRPTASRYKYVSFHQKQQRWLVWQNQKIVGRALTEEAALEIACQKFNMTEAQLLRLPQLSMNA